MTGKRLRILTWHVHGSYLYYLAHCGHELVLPVKSGRPDGYGGRSGSFPWPDNVREVPADRVHREQIDVVLFQSRRNYLEDQHAILSERQRGLPRIYLEHDPPREHPTDTRHPVDDPDVLLVHVTAFNDLMWDSGRTPTRVIEHGVVVADDVRYTGEVPRGVSVVNGMDWRGRRVGADVFRRASTAVPLDLAGMGSEEFAGVGDVPLGRLHRFIARYRFFFNPIRYTSLGLAVCEAMMLGMPVVALATTEYATVVVNGVNGYADTNLGRLVERMVELIGDRAEARRLGEGARRTAMERFHIARFRRDWNEAFADVTGTRPSTGALAGEVA